MPCKWAFHACFCWCRRGSESAPCVLLCSYGLLPNSAPLPSERHLTEHHLLVSMHCHVMVFSVHQRVPACHRVRVLTKNCKCRLTRVFAAQPAGPSRCRGNSHNQRQHDSAARQCHRYQAPGAAGARGVQLYPGGLWKALYNLCQHHRCAAPLQTSAKL